MNGNHYLNSLNRSEVLLLITGWNVLGFCCSQRKRFVRVKEMEPPWLEIMCRDFGALCVCVCVRRDLRSGRDTGVMAERASCPPPPLGVSSSSRDCGDWVFLLNFNLGLIFLTLHTKFCILPG